MDWVPNLLSGLSLVAVVVIGWRSVLSSERSRKAAEKSTKVSVQAARNALREGRMERVEGLLNILIEMSDLYSRQMGLPGRRRDGWRPELEWPEGRARDALCRRLEVRLVLFGELPDDSMIKYLARSIQWNDQQLEEAIIEAKVKLASASVSLELAPED